MEKYFIVYFGQDEKDGLLPIEPLCVLKEEDINREEGEVCVNGEWEFFDSESSNFYNDEGDLAYECQPGDLVFESMGILAFYRKGLNTPTPVVGGFSDAIIGTVPEIKEYMADYVKEMGEDFATVNFNESKNMKQNKKKLTESQLKKIVAESVKNVLKEWDGYHKRDNSRENIINIPQHPEDNVTPGDSLPIVSTEPRDKNRTIWDDREFLGGKKQLKLTQLRHSINNILTNLEANGQPYRLASVAKDLAERYGFQEGYVLDTLKKAYRHSECHNAIDESKTNKNMKQNTIRLNESQLKKIVAESVKRVLKEADDFNAHGYKTLNNYGGNEIQINNSGNAARLKFQNGEITDWLEIEFDNEGVAYITTPNGQQEKLSDYMRY